MTLALALAAVPAMAADAFADRVMEARVAAGVDPQRGLARLRVMRREVDAAPDLAHRLMVDEAECRVLTDLDASQALQVAQAGLAAAGRAEPAAARDPWLRLRVCQVDMLFERGDVAAAQAAMDALLAESAGPDDAGPHALALLTRGNHGSRQGQMEAAQRDLLQSCEQLDRLGPPRDHELCLGLLSNHYRRIGDADEALRLLLRLNERAQARGATYDLSIYGYGMGQALQTLKRWDESVRSLEQAREASLRLGDVLGVIYAEHAMAEALRETGQPEQALALTEAALVRLDRQADPRQYEIISTTRAGVLVRLGQAAQALAALEAIEPAVRQRGDQGNLRAWLAARSQALALTGRWREAYEALVEGQSLDSRMNAQALSEQSARLRKQFNRARDAEDLRVLRQLNEQGQRLRQAQGAALALFVALLAVALWVAMRKFRQARHLQTLASTDELTGLPNRRAVMAFAGDAVGRAQGAGSPLALLMIDIDHFKRINDTHGHAMGDEVLRQVGRVLPAGLREHDRVGRLGGEEFLAVLPGAPVDRAEQVAQRMRGAIGSIVLDSPQGPLHFTVSIGVAGWRPGESVDRVVARADAALYRAKSEGRDRIVLDG